MHAKKHFDYVESKEDISRRIVCGGSGGGGAGGGGGDDIGMENNSKAIACGGPH